MFLRPLVLKYNLDIITVFPDRSSDRLLDTLCYGGEIAHQIYAFWFFLIVYRVLCTYKPWGMHSG